MPSPSPLISVCILTARRHAALDACLASLAAQESPPAFELLVASDGDHEVPGLVRRRFDDATVGMVRGAHLGAARNFMVERARGDLLLFLDDDVIVRPDLLRRLADEAARRPDVHVFGGPNETPPGSSRFQIVQGAVLASMVASGPVRRRYGARRSGPADERFFTLCNLAVRRSAMLPFAPELLGGEENQVLTEMSRNGVLMHYDPELTAYHERSPGWRRVASQMHKYGRGRGQLMRIDPRTARPAYFAPSALLVYAAALPALGRRSWRVAAPVALYGAAIGASAVKVGDSLSKSPGIPATRSVPLAAALTLLVHGCYGLGVLRGLAETPVPRDVDGGDWHATPLERNGSDNEPLVAASAP